MPRRVLITGITGFAGSHLAERALARGDLVHGLAHDGLPTHLAALADRVRLHRADVTDADAVRAAMRAAAPEVVVHLAGQAVPALAAADPRATAAVNVGGTGAVVEALRGTGAALVFASTAEVYGEPTGPAREDTPLDPPNVYAASKVAAEAIVRRYDGPAVILRPVTQVGPRQHPSLAASAFARQVALAEAGLAEPVIEHGRLDSRRDLLDVRDMARAYLLAMDLATVPAATYNVGSGRTVEMRVALDTLVALARVPLRTHLDPARVRPNDPRTVDVDAGAFRERTGWAPEIGLERSLADLLDHWRAAVRDEAAARV